MHNWHRIWKERKHINIYIYIYIYKRICLVVLFKHHNTYFYSHVFPQHLNNITRTILPNKILRGVKLEHQLVLESTKWKQQGNHSFFFFLFIVRIEIPCNTNSSDLSPWDNLSTTMKGHVSDPCHIIFFLHFFHSFSSLQIYQIQKISLFYQKNMWLNPFSLLH